jgi:hypothetical protein
MIELKTNLIPHLKPLDYLFNQFESLLQDYLTRLPNPQFTAEQVHLAFAYARVSILPSLMAQDAIVYLLKYPFYSFTASGKWDEFVYVTTAGKTYLRRYVIPRNPRTAPQQTQRNYFRIAVAHYQQESPETKLFWKEQAKSIRGKSGYNLYLGEVIKLLQQGLEPPIGFRG